jgi:hypothetical protein
MFILFNDIERELGWRREEMRNLGAVRRSGTPFFSPLIPTLPVGNGVLPGL